MKKQKFSMNRLQWILTGALALQVILAVLVNLPQSTQASGGPLLEGYDPTNIVEILIENQTGDQLHLKRGDGSWVLPEKGNFPVKVDKVTELLEKIKKVQTNRLVTRTAASHSQLMVAQDDFMTKIVLKEAGGGTYRLFLGTSGGFGATHIRRSGTDQVYLTAELASWEVSTSLSSWIETGYLSLEQDQIQAISVQNSNGTFKFVKGTEGTWAYEGLGESEEFDADAFQTTVSRLASLRMVEPLGVEEKPSYQLEEPSATVVLVFQNETESTSQVTLTIGGKLDGNVAAKASNSPYYVKIAQVNVTSLVEMDHEGLLVVEPTPTPTP